MTETETKVAAAEEPTKTTEEEAPESTDEATTTPANVSKLEGSIIRQLEYYFGDANLARDKFLLEQISKEEGWVPLDVLLTFKRLNPTRTDRDQRGPRKAASPPGTSRAGAEREKRKEIYARTSTSRDRPEDGTQMNELLEFFEPYEKVSNIVMRKYHDKATKKYLFKGSVFVTFANKEQAAEFLKKEKLTYKEKELICKSQDDYFEQKKAERKKKDKKKEEEKFDIGHLPKVACVHLDGFGKETSRETIKETILKLDESLEVAFIDYQKTDSNGVVRFSTEGNGKKFVEKLTDNKITIDDEEITARLLEGDEETEFLRKVVKDQAARRAAQGGRNKGRFQKGGHRNHKNGGGGHGGKKRKTEDESSAEPATKKVTTEAKADA
ncbi:lupus la ribonucleoprotein [Culex quinquefasciatus]|uniref:Lupus la ribonucleoprotein n=1 Tax=Culex quinquefasciatus TaxID=7176 RepID=B0XCK8_CULQU|nr:lupus la ribonucleoprotein [Culex quinquefasciatus]|eukprot:XP_001867380.1 lupus la ribonucleoprotein [Culex quinquefasciatus]